MHSNLADMTFGIEPQALAVAQLLSTVEMEGQGFINTAPWYNGRERGIVFSFQPMTKADTLHIAIFEHRNSDHLCALRWTEPMRTNPPTIESSGDKAYPTDNKYDIAHTAACWHVGDMAKWVKAQMEAYIAEHQPPKRG